MVFSSLEFLVLFLPIVLIGYLLLFFSNTCRNLWLLLASLAFYYLGAKEQILLLLSVILIAYAGGYVVSVMKQQRAKRTVMTLSVGAMLLVMSYFKYFSWMVENLNMIFHRSAEIPDIALPIGISFFTFQAISYVVDVYRGEDALANPVDTALYISFFPQLIAGPIVRFHDIREYLDKKHRKADPEQIADGLWRFSVGLCKKVLLANNLGGLAGFVFGMADISQFSVLYTWLGAIAYTLQIYYDFSGYSDMAIGLGRVFGFEFRENFNYPYAAGTIREFWRRWHISLSQFFRDYVYIPLGGNRCGTGRWFFNMMIVWFLTGLWHGASWNYVLWGLGYGILLVVERLVLDPLPQNCLTRIVRRVLTMFTVILLWVVFRCEQLSKLTQFLRNLFGIGAASLVDSAFLFQAENFALLILIAVVLALPVKQHLSEKITESAVFRILEAAALFAGVVGSVSYIYMGSYNPFLYFMF